jgi:lipoate-protein ligase A
VKAQLIELHSYDDIRSLREPTALVCAVSQTTVVLGSTQADDIVASSPERPAAYRRRRGGGGAVLLQPDDLWIDWWIPASDTRYRSDLADQSLLAGQWWVEALAHFSEQPFRVHVGAMVLDERFKLICFAGLAQGEVTLRGKKVVGVTQWRVREGALVSTLLCADVTTALLSYLHRASHNDSEIPVHETLKTLGLAQQRQALTVELLQLSGEWNVISGPLGPVAAS